MAKYGVDRSPNNVHVDLDRQTVLQWVITFYSSIGAILRVIAVFIAAPLIIMGEHFDYSDFAANFVDRHKYVLEVSTFGFLASIFMFMKFATRDLDIILRSKGDRISPSVDFSHSEVPALRSYFATRSLYWCFTILAPFAVTAAADPGAYDVVFQSTLIPLILITTVPPLYLYHLLQEPPPSMARVAPATPPA